MGNKISKNALLCGFFTLITVASIAFFLISYKSNESMLKKDKEMIGSLTNSIYLTQNENSAKRKKLLTSLSGYDVARMERDEKTAKDFLTRVLSWNSYSSYMKNRKYIKETYKLKDDSSFLHAFFPVIESKRLNGKNVNIIDAKGLNMKLDDFKSFLVSIGNGYRYMTIVNVTTTSNKNGGRATGGFIFGYTITADGQIKDLSADAIADTLHY